MAGIASCDFAICGSNRFAGLLAGLLATAHGKRVCLIGDDWSPYRLIRSYDLSVTAATRPETWLMLKRGGAETIKLLATIGRGLYERVDPLFVADTPATADYLGHMRWVAVGLGFAAERAIERSITTDGALCRVRDAAMLVTGKVEPAIEAWLSKSGVARLAPSNTAITFRRDGVAVLNSGADAVDAQTVVLAADDAITTLLPAADRHRLLRVAPRTTLLTEATAKPLNGTLIEYLDRDVAMHQRGGKGPITAIAGGDPDTALPKIGAGIAALGALRRAGQSRFLGAGTVDGAPLIGRMGKGRMLVVAGLGSAAAFLAPLVARHLVGAGSDDEKAYFTAREIARAANRAAVADFAPAQPEVAS
jgi:hypothetical protein